MRRVAHVKKSISTKPAGSLLVVDDDKGFVHHVSDLLADRFDDVYTANSLAEAETILERKRIDYALLDFMLPDGNGVELGVTIRKRFDTTVAIVTVMRTLDGRFRPDFTRPRRCTG